MMSLQQALMDSLPEKANGTTLSCNDQMQGAYCCVNCRKEIKRKEINVLGRVFRPLPVCECVSKKFEQEQAERELAERRQIVKSIYGKGLIDTELESASFDGFEPREGTHNAFKAAKRFAEKFRDQQAGLYLFGPVGVGKSHLAAAIHNFLSEMGYASVYIDVTQLFGLAKSTFRSNGRKTDQDYVQAAIKCELLTLDEIGLAPLTEYEFRLLFQILNGRKGKLTNFTSNLNLDRLEQWFRYGKDRKLLDEDGRLFDRLVGGSQPIEIKAESYRKYKAAQRMNAL